jgi:hypothetical protein
MYAPDLATECFCANAPHVRAIGWLEDGHKFPQGAIDPRVPTILRGIVTDAARLVPVVSWGIHHCDLGGCTGEGGSHYVVIPSPSCVYIAPDLVVHYIDAHHYAPPAEFVDAVLACPEQLSDAYVELLMPFVSSWGEYLDADRLRQCAAEAPQRRREHAEYIKMIGDKRGFWQ